MIDYAITVVDLFQYVRIVRLLLLGRSHQGTDASSVMSVKFRLGLGLGLRLFPRSGSGALGSQVPM